MALAAYRQILRAARVTFQGDSRILLAAQVEARTRFNDHISLPADAPQTKRKIIEAEEIARILRQNIVQGEQRTGIVGDEQRYQLRIHDEIERGDNASIKKGSNLATAGGVCCGGAR